MEPASGTPCSKKQGCQPGRRSHGGWCGRASLSRTDVLVDRINRNKSLPWCVDPTHMKQNQFTARAVLSQGSALSLRTDRRNPNHHLWWNNGTWWLNATVHRPDYTKHRLRVPLETKDVGLARSRRDAVLGAWSQEHGGESRKNRLTIHADLSSLPLQALRKEAA